MPLTNIEYGSLASSEVMNNNFEYLDNKITQVANNLVSTSSSIYSNIASLNSTLTQTDETLASGISALNSTLNILSAKDITPDYASAITVLNSSGSGTYNIDWNGWLAFDLYCNQINANFQFCIDNVKVGATASDEGDRAAGIVMVKSGSVASWNGSQSILIKKIPFLGE